MFLSLFFYISSLKIIKIICDLQMMMMIMALFFLYKKKNHPDILDLTAIEKCFSKLIF